MKIKTKLGEVISGGIGTLAGAMGSGGAHLRRKIITAPIRSDGQKKIPIWFKEATGKWDNMNITIKEAWGRYGKTLIDKNKTGHPVYKSGWQAFVIAHGLLKEGGRDTIKIETSAPSNEGYLPNPQLRIWTNGLNYKLTVMSGLNGRATIYLSNKTSNTINKNQKGYNLLFTNSIREGTVIDLPCWACNGRFFWKVRFWGNGGNFSRSKTYHHDLGPISNSC